MGMAVVVATMRVPATMRVLAVVVATMRVPAIVVSRAVTRTDTCSHAIDSRTQRSSCATAIAQTVSTPRLLTEYAEVF